MSSNSSTKSSVNSSGKALSESSTKPLPVTTIVSNAKFEVEKFDGTNNFGMWNAKLWMSLSNQSWILLWKTNLKGC